MSHVSPGAEEGGCVTSLLCTRRSMLCHMFRLGLKKAVVSHVSPGAEEGCGVTCFAVWSKKRVVSHVCPGAQEGCCVTC